MKSLLFVLASLLSTLPLMAGFDVSANVPRDTVLFGKVDLAQLRQSPIFLNLIEQETVRYTTFSSFFSDNIGLELNTLEAAWILAPKKDKGVVILQGKFDPNRIQQCFGKLPNVTPVARAETFFAAKFMDDKKPEPRLMAIMDDQTIVVGEMESVDHYLETLGLPERLWSAGRPDIRQVVESKQALCLTMIGGPDRWNDFDPQLAALIEDFWLKGTLKNSVDLVLTITTLQPEQADALASLAEGLIKLKSLAPTEGQAEDKPLLRATLKTGTVVREGKTLTLTFSVPGEQILDSVAVQH